ncbi:MAG: hypothetical protein NZ481_07375, partial [Candidatus Kapabacteria bacterium]|nr:hypothetical protein [Candidatus Kapabacteria bacterium]
AVTYAKLQNATGSGYLLVSGSGGAWGELAPGTTGQVLTMTTSGPAWQAVTFTETDPQVGTLSDGQVAFWSGGSGGALTGSSNLYWDASNSRLGIGTSTPATALHVAGTVTASQYNGQLQYGVSAGSGLTGGTFNNTGNVTLALSTTGVTAGTYGNATHVAQITVDAQGRITSASNVAISFPAETDPEVSMTTTNQLARWNGTALVDGSLADDGSGVLSRSGNIQINPGSGNTLSTDGNLSVSGNATISLTATVNGNLTVGGSTTLGSPLAHTPTQVFSSSSSGAALTVVNNGTGNGIEVKGSIIPLATQLYDLGSGTAEWNSLYVVNTLSSTVTVSNSLTVSGTTQLGSATSHTPTNVFSQDNTGPALTVANYGTGPALQVGATGNGIKAILHGTVEVDPPDIGANSSETFTVTINGVVPGDRIFLTPPNTLEDGLVFQGAAVTANDTVTIKIRNVGGVLINGAQLDWSYLVIRP